MNFLPFFLLAAVLRTFLQPLQEMTMLEVKVHAKRMMIMNVISFATFHLFLHLLTRWVRQS